jgi:hypothetical protein
MKDMTTEEFRERIKAALGLKPAGYYNPPADEQELAPDELRDAWINENTSFQGEEDQ